MKKEKNKNKKMTLDRVARMVADGFGEVNSKITKLATREEMNNRFGELEGKLEAYTSFWHRKFSEHEAWLQNLDKSVAHLERRIDKK